ncbi:MAG TPA: cyclase family protein [Blastocatellia bacterium]|nr:cyclase family protein [Blastocatellia bacterium]
MEDRRFVDLSHAIFDGLITYRGLPAPVICDYLSREQSREIYAPGTEFQIGKIELVSNTGTYLDCPFHRYQDGKDLAQTELECFTDLEGIVIRADHSRNRAVGAEFFKAREIRGRAVLVHTGWDRYWNTDRYFENPPSLTAEAADYLQRGGARLVGIDSMNIDDLEDRSRPVHSILLKSEILIVEHLCNLDQLPDEGFTFSAIPPRLVGVGTFPVRALAKLRRFQI